MNDAAPAPAKPTWLRKLFGPIAPPPPFAGARWVLWVLAAWLGFACTVAQHRYRGPHYFEVVVLTVALLACCWEVHVQALKAPGATMPWLRLVCNVLALACLTVPVIFALAIISPHGHSYTDRMHVSEMILAASPAKIQITERARTGVPLQSIGVGVAIPVGQRVGAAQISGDGVIMLASSEPPSVVMLVPHAKPAERPGDALVLEWICTGSPAKFMPASCR